MKARIVIGSNYGDEGKGTVVATYTKHSDGVLNVLTNGGAQRGHSILTEDGSITFQHFGAGTYHGADNYYSRYFILNPMKFVEEYDALIVKPRRIFRDAHCLWSTPYDSMANLISEQLKKRHASCCMGIWNTIKRTKDMKGGVTFDDFMGMPDDIARINYLTKVKNYYEKRMQIPEAWKSIWDSPNMMYHFIDDCRFMAGRTIACGTGCLFDYENVIFENGQGLLLCDTGKDTYDTTPSNTGIEYALDILNEIGAQPEDITAHYVTRPYLTRHGDGNLTDESSRSRISSAVGEDRTNHFNDGQGEFRYGTLDIGSLKDRIVRDARGINFEIEVTHCDEMDRIAEFKKSFRKVNVYDSALIR